MSSKIRLKVVKNIGFEPDIQIKSQLFFTTRTKFITFFNIAIYSEQKFIIEDRAKCQIWLREVNKKCIIRFVQNVQNYKPNAFNKIWKYGPKNTPKNY